MSFPAVYESEDAFGVSRDDIITVRLTDGGDPAGSFEIIGDYSVTPGLFFAVVPPSVNWHIRRLVFYIAGVGNVTANSYGPVAALTNGMTFEFEDSTGTPIVPPFPLLLKLNGNFQEVGFGIEVQDTGPGINHVTFTVDFVTLTGVPIVLGPGDRIAARPADDLTVLSNHTIFAAGYSLKIL